MTGMTQNGSERLEGAKKRSGFIPGYTPTLIRTDVKDLLTDWRRQHGYAHTENAERCIASAALHLCLTQPDLRTRFLAALDSAVASDFRTLRGETAAPNATVST